MNKNKKEIIDNNKESKPKRKSLSKKMRFEVFKRDSFTCQYCGKRSPDTILHVDHIKPVAAGGKNIIMNLVTSCMECNIGKGATNLSDKSIVEKSHNQAQFLQERREQIEMMRDWQISLVDETNISIEAVNMLFSKLTNGKLVIADSYKYSTISKLINKYGVDNVLEALRVGADGYGDPQKALSKLPGICHCRKNPEVNTRVYLLYKMDKKFSNFNRYEATSLIQQGFNAGGNDFYIDVENFILEQNGYWNQVKPFFKNLVSEWIKS